MSTKEITNGYEVVGVTTPTQVVPDVEMLCRDDEDSGRWSVYSCPPVSGEPKTAVSERLMFVPTYDDGISRHIRAHEMFHARVSPTTKLWEKVWKKRGYANERTMVACEELRVNTLMKHAGFEPEKYLTGGGEKQRAIQMATHNDFQNAVLSAVSLTNSAGLADFIDGIAMVRPEWLPVITEISKQSVNYYQEILTNTDNLTDFNFPLNATGTKPYNNGFGYVEQLAKWVEGVIGAITTPKDKKEGKDAKGEVGKPSKDGVDKDGKELSKELKKLLEGIKSSAETQRHEVSGWKRGNIPRRALADIWEELKVSNPALTRSVIGAIGKKRVASATGRNPRRMSRLLTDPERRIFDRTVRGAGGVLLIDTSGSMRLTSENVKEMVAYAPSALVAQYSGGSRIKPNLYVIANKGRMVDTLPRPNGGNGVDLPALKWAVKKRQRQNSPIIWVSDGGVTGKRDAHNEDLVMDCIKLLKKEGIYVVPDPQTAIELLKKLQRREKITSVIPYTLSETYKDLTGQNLVLR